MPEPSRPAAVLPLSLAALLLTLPLIAAIAPAGPVWRAATGPLALVLLAAAVLGSLLHLRLTTRPRSLDAASPRRALLMATLFAHAALLLQRPLFSNDLYRYLLDARLAARNLNPFAYAPDHPAIADLAAGLLPAINHPEMVTVYPPGAQALFLVSALPGPDVLIWKIACFIALLTAALILPRVTGRHHHGILLLSHPLALLAVSSGGHLDAFGILIIVLAMLAWARGRPVLTALVLAAGVLIKLFPVGLVLAALPRHGPRLVAAGLALVIAVVAAGYLPLVARGGPATGSLGEYAARWEYNAGAWRIMHRGTDLALRCGGIPDVVRIPREQIPSPMRPPPRPVAGHPDTFVSLSRGEVAWKVARGMALVVLVITLATAWRRRLDAQETALWLLLALFLTAPTVHPWYLLWLLPLALAQRSLPALLFCALAVVAFAGPAMEAAGLGWQDPVWMAALVHGPVLVLIAMRVRRGQLPEAAQDSRAAPERGGAARGRPSGAT